MRSAERIHFSVSKTVINSLGAKVNQIMAGQIIKASVGIPFFSALRIRASSSWMPENTGNNTRFSTLVSADEGCL